MLVLTRKPGQSIFIGNNVKVFVSSIEGKTVSLAIEAPAEIAIVRDDAKSTRPKLRLAKQK